VDRLGHHLLAGAVLAEDQHGQLGVGHAADDGAEGLDLGALADEPDLLGSLLGHLAAGREELLPVLGILEGHGGVAGQFDQGRLVLGGEGAALLVDQLEGPEQLARLGAERDAEDGPRAVAGLGVDAAVDQIGVGGGVGAAGLAALHDPAHHAAVVGHAELAAFDAQGRPADQHAGPAVPEEDAGAVAAQEPGGGLGHLGEQRLKLLGLVPTLRDFQDGLKSLDLGAIPVSRGNRRKLLGGQGHERCEHGECLLRGRAGAAADHQHLDHAARRDQRQRNPIAPRLRRLLIGDLGRQFEGQGFGNARLGHDGPASLAGSGEGEVACARGGRQGWQHAGQIRRRIGGAGPPQQELGSQGGQARVCAQGFWQIGFRAGPVGHKRLLSHAQRRSPPTIPGTPATGL